MKPSINILVDFEAMYFYENNKADQFRVIESAFIIKQNNIVMTQFVSKIYLSSSLAQRANKRVLKLLQLNKEDLPTFPAISVTSKALLKMEKRLKSLNKQHIQFICWGSEDKKYLSALIDQIHQDKQGVLDKKWWLSLPWLRLDTQFKTLTKRSKSTALSNAFNDLKAHRLVKGKLPKNIHNALDDCRLLEKLLHSYEVGNFQRLFSISQPPIKERVNTLSMQHQVVDSKVISSNSNDVQQLRNEILLLKDEVIALKALVNILINQST